MSETTIELSFNGVHNHNPTIKVLEELAMDEWRKTARRSRIPETTAYHPPDYPQVITADKIVNELENMNHRLKSLEKLMKKIMDRISKFESKAEELEFKILSYESSE